MPLAEKVINIYFYFWIAVTVYNLQKILSWDIVPNMRQGERQRNNNFEKNVG